VNIRKHDVEQDDRRLIFADPGDDRLALIQQRRLITPAAQVLTKDFAQLLLVLDDQGFALHRTILEWAKIPFPLFHSNFPRSRSTLTCSDPPSGSRVRARGTCRREHRGNTLARRPGWQDPARHSA